MRKIKAAEADFRRKAGRYGGLKELAAAGLINSSIADGASSGYRFDVRPAHDTYTAVAVPETYMESGGLSFYIDESAVIRGGDRKGAEADATDQQLAEEYQ